MAQSSPVPGAHKQKNYFVRLGINIVRHRWVYAMMIPVLAYYILFHYGPLYGVQIAFKQFSPGRGIWGSPWVGLRWFQQFFSGPYAYRTVRNTLMINLYGLIFGFPAPILLAILLDEVFVLPFKKTVQTITYLPHFISTVVIAGILVDFCSTNGLFNQLALMINPAYTKTPLLGRPDLFRKIYVGSDIWQGVGWNSIIYIAALSGVDAELFDAVAIDGGNRFHRIWHVSLPSILPTIVIMLILRIGNMMTLGYEKIILLYNTSTYEVADVISSYVYRIGLQDFNYSLSAAVGLMNNVVNFILVISANAISRRLTETSLW